MEISVDADLIITPSDEAKICMTCNKKKCTGRCERFRDKLKKLEEAEKETGTSYCCKDCKFFIQGEGRSGRCKKRPFCKYKSGQIQKKPDGTPIKFVVFCGTRACKKYFEKGDTE